MLAFHHNDALLVIAALVLHCYLNLYRCFVGRYLGRGNKHTILSDVQRGHRFKPHVAVDAGTAVPAAVRLLGVVHLDDDLVSLLFVLIQILRHIDGERCIAIMMLPSQLAVHIDFGFLIYALEVEFDQGIIHYQFSIIHCKPFPVLALAGLEPSAASARSTLDLQSSLLTLGRADASIARLSLNRSLARIGTFEDIPIVRQVHGLRRAIVGKLPAEVKQLTCLC